MRAFATRAVHGANTTPHAHGSLRPPLFDSAAFEFSSARDLELAFAGQKPAHSYSRITNPTVEELERRIALLANAFAVIGVSSGMAAITNVAMALSQSGMNIVTTRFLFGHTRSLFETTLARFGISIRLTDFSDPSTIESVIDEQTAFVFLETITNPQLEVADITAISSIAARRNVPVILDGTLTTPYLFDAKAAGVAVEVLSSTKYISGGATTIGGLVVDYGTFDWGRTSLLTDTFRKAGPGALALRLRREIYRNTGSCLAPHNAWLQLLGIETLPLRIEKSCENALSIARFLEQHPAVNSVNYPGLATSPFHGIARRQFGNRFGGILTFDLGTRERSFALIDALQLIRRATNVNDNKTLIIHPASTIFGEFSPEERTAMRIPDGQIRLSLGIEDAADIMEDLSQGLERL